MIKAGGQFFGHAEVIRRSLLSQVISLKTIGKMSQVEARGYARYIEENSPDKNAMTPAARTNLANLRSSVNGPAQSAARAYAP